MPGEGLKLVRGVEYKQDDGPGAVSSVDAALCVQALRVGRLSSRSRRAGGRRRHPNELPL
jgi:hypothetical protein